MSSSHRLVDEERWVSEIEENVTDMVYFGGEKMWTADSICSKAEADDDAGFNPLIVMRIEVCQVIFVGGFSVDAVCEVRIGTVKVYI